MVVIIIVQTAQSLRYRSGDYAGNEKKIVRQRLKRNHTHTHSVLSLRHRFGDYAGNEKPHSPPLEDNAGNEITCSSGAQAHTQTHSALSWGSKKACVPPTHDLSLL